MFSEIWFSWELIIDLHPTRSHSITRCLNILQNGRGITFSWFSDKGFPLILEKSSLFYCRHSLFSEYLLVGVGLFSTISTLHSRSSGEQDVCFQPLLRNSINFCSKSEIEDVFSFAIRWKFSMLNNDWIGSISSVFNYSLLGASGWKPAWSFFNICCQNRWNFENTFLSFIWGNFLQKFWSLISF